MEKSKLPRGLIAKTGGKSREKIQITTWLNGEKRGVSHAEKPNPPRGLIAKTWGKPRGKVQSSTWLNGEKRG